MQLLTKISHSIINDLDDKLILIKTTTYLHNKP